MIVVKKICRHVCLPEESIICILLIFTEQYGFMMHKTATFSTKIVHSLFYDTKLNVMIESLQVHCFSYKICFKKSA